MYHSRIHVSGSGCTIALDSMTGELLELHDAETGENYIKNSCYAQPQPFVLYTMDHKKRYPPDSRQVLENPSLRCEITTAGEKEKPSVSVHYHALTDGTELFPADVRYTVQLDEKKQYWKLEIRQTEEALRSVRFPCINGIYLGETWEDDTLYYPGGAGQRFENPVSYFARPLCTLDWRWQEYRYRYQMNSCIGTKDADGLYALRGMYPGNLSMSYFDYCDETSGFYYGCHQEHPMLCVMAAATPGPLNPCMCFYTQFEVTLDKGENWQSPDMMTALHAGDWHAGADLYRAYKQPKLDPVRPRPAWFDKSAGLLAHYDFKYQNGNTVHTYRDIPALQKQAERFGLSHLLFAGWHRDGFDNGFPMYETDPDLGTEEELHDGISSSDKIHTTFYINSRLANTKYKDISDRVVIQADGKPAIAHFGFGKIDFGIMCPSSKPWQEELGGILSHAKEAYGIDGVYLDCLSGGSCYCFSKEHGHAPGAWCDGFKTILQNAEPLHLCLMGEFICDEYGPYLSAQLQQSFFFLKNGVFPELYRYTFPEHMLMDMLYPSQNLAMRPVFVEQNSDRLMRTAFADGMYFWIYDLEDDNTFERDPKQMEKLRRVIALRKAWLSRYGQGIFRDICDCTAVPESCTVRTYRHTDGCLIACVNPTGKEQTVSVRRKASRAELLTDRAWEEPSDLSVHCQDGISTVVLPADEYAVIFLTE